MPSTTSATRPLLRDLPPPGRLFVAALRAGRTDLRTGCAWADGELLALCDAAGLRRCAAARVGACAAFLLREATVDPLCLGASGCAGVTGSETALAAAIAGSPPAVHAARRMVAGWLPVRRRLPGLVLLDLAAQDLAAWASRQG